MNAPTQQLSGPLPLPPGGPESGRYDAFLSYTHEDRPVAKAVQDALHRIGRHFGQRRALRVFRDDTNLEVSQDLWGKITDAMDDARFMVLVLSPLAAKSQWVNEEVKHWLARRNGLTPMIVLAGGRLEWDKVNRCFNPLLSDAAPPALTVPGVLPGEPFFLDVSGDGPPWSASSAGFRDKMTALAAPMHGKPKDQLAGDDLREYRKLRRLRAATITGLAILSVVALVAGGIAAINWRNAIEQRQNADHQRDEAIAARLTAEAGSMLDDSGSGNDVQALRQLLAARTVTDHPDDSALYDAVVAKQNVVRIIDAGAAVYGGSTNPDSTRIVTGGGSDVAHIWDLETGQSVDPPLTGHTDPISAAVWSRDGELIVTGSYDRTVRLWDAGTGQQIGDPGQHDGAVMTVAFSPNGELVASAGEDFKVRLWSVTADGLTPLPILGEHQAAVRAVAFSPDGTRLASVGADALLRLWDVGTRQPISRSFDPTKFVPLGVSWAADNRTLATAGWDGVIRLWDADTGGPPTGELVGHHGPVINTLFVGDYLVSGGFDRTIRLWDVPNKKQVGDAFTGPDGGVAVNFATEGRIAAVSNDHTIRLLDILVGQQLANHDMMVSSLAFSPDRNLFASGSWDGTVGLFDASKNTWKSGLPGDELSISKEVTLKSVTNVLFGPGGRLVVGRFGDIVEVWDVDGPPRRVDDGSLHTCWPHGSMALSDDGSLLAVGCPQSGAPDLGAVQLLYLDRADRTPVFINDDRGAVGPIALSPDGQYFASASGTTIQLWSVDSHEPVGPLLDRHTDGVTALAFGADGDRLVSVSGDNTVELWDIPTRTAISQSTPEGNMITSVAYSTDGSHVVTGTIDGRVRLWSVEGDDVRPIGSPKSRQAGQIAAVAISRDGDRYLSSAADGSLRQWPVEASPKQLCDKLTPMSDEEWAAIVTPAVPRRPACPKAE
jgi:WD40 repeat protein